LGEEILERIVYFGEIGNDMQRGAKEELLLHSTRIV
jgi:hypothetical protein